MVEAEGPLLATVIPVYNEEQHIRACLESLLHQTLDAHRHMILVLDGGSTDRTMSIVESLMTEFASDQFPGIECVANPSRTVAHARNMALEHLPDSVEYLVEMIGHAVVDKDHLQQRLDAWEALEPLLSRPLAAMGVKVVGREDSQGLVSGWIEAALQSPLGQSGGQFATFTSTEPTAVPAFVMHRRSAVQEVGGWDTEFITSQDSDLSMRLIKAGFVLYRTPATSVMMHKRSRLLNWWKMGHRYGFWRTKLLKRHPKRAKWQEFLPWVGGGLTAALVLFGSSTWWFPAALYGGVLALNGIVHAINKRDPLGVLGVPLCLVMLHVSFSLGLLDGLFRKGRLPSDRS